MEKILSYVTEQALILIPVLYILGMILKGTEKLNDKFIPITLLPVGIVFSVWMMGLTVDAVIQGVLITGCAVYVNQIIKQSSKKE